jgi:hypothetical protein
MDMRPTKFVVNEKIIVAVDGNIALYSGCINKNKGPGAYLRVGEVAGKSLVKKIQAFGNNVCCIKIYFDGIRPPRKHAFACYKPSRSFNKSAEMDKMISIVENYFDKKINVEIIYLDIGEAEHEAYLTRDNEIATAIISNDSDLFHIIAGINYKLPNLYILRKQKDRGLECFVAKNLSWVHDFPFLFRIICALKGTDYTPQNILTSKMCKCLIQLMKNISYKTDKHIHKFIKNHFILAANATTIRQSIRNIIFILIHYDAIEPLRWGTEYNGNEDFSKDYIDFTETITWMVNYSKFGSLAPDYNNDPITINSNFIRNRKTIFSYFINDTKDHTMSFNDLAEIHLNTCKCYK